MPIESFVTAFQTTLAAAITGTGAITLSLAAPLPTLTPASGQLRVLIDNELILIPAGSSGSSIAIPSGNRGIEGTTAATHANAAAVTAVVTAAGLTNLLGPGYGTYANLPAVGIGGQTYQESDGQALWRWDQAGAAWKGYVGKDGPITAPPAIANWTWVNQSTATATQRGSSIYLNGPATSAFSDSAELLVRTRPGSATPWTVTALFSAELMIGSFPTAGLWVRNSTSGKLAGFYWSQRNNSSSTNVPLVGLFYEYWTSPTAEASTASSDHHLQYSPQPFWFQLSDNGTNLIFRTSLNGIDWIQLVSVSRTAFDASGADQVGFGVNTHQASSYPTAIHLLSWKEETV